MGVKKLREKVNMSQREFADLFHIPLNTLCQWESGRRTPPRYVLLMMAKILGADLEVSAEKCIDQEPDKY